MQTNTTKEQHLILPNVLNLNALKEIKEYLSSLKHKKIIINGGSLQYIDTNCFVVIKYWLLKHNKIYELQEFEDKFMHIWDQIDLVNNKNIILKTSVITNFMGLIKEKINIFNITWDLFEKIFLYKNNKTNKAQKKLFYNNFYSNINEIGIKSLSIFALIMFFLGIVIAFQGAYQLSMFAAELYVIDFLSLSMFRELGPILTGIILASRTGSAITAQIGTMKNNDELTMLSLIGLNPVKFILLPKMLALLFISPFLTLFACIMAMLGGMMIFVFYLQYSYKLFISLFLETLSAQSFFMFLWKGPLFAFFIGIIACTKGMMVKQNALDLSKKITSSVVAGLISVLMIDGVISVVSTFL